MGKKLLGPKIYFVKKKLKSNNNFGENKKISKIILSPKNILYQKIIFKKNLVPKNFGLKKGFV